MLRPLGFAATALCALCALSSPLRAQEAVSPTTARDQLLDELLERAAAKERLGDYEQAVDIYLELEARLEKRREKDPQERPTTEVGPGLDRGIGLYLRDRVALLPAEARLRYKQTIDPRAKLALERAIKSGEPEQLEAVLARFPLSSIAERGLALLAGRALERGELRRALRAYRALEARARAEDQREPAQEAALRRAFVAALRGEGPEARRALASYTELGGSADPAFGDSTLAAAVARLPEAARASGPPRFDVGGPLQPVPLQLPELPSAWARGGVPPAYQSPLYDPERGLLYVADNKSVRAFSGEGLAEAWFFTVADQSSEPSRLEALAAEPALGGGRIYATLHRNRPARVALPAKKNEPAQVARQRDWRVVALNPRTGQLLWDAATDKGFVEFAEQAEWVSPPLYFEGGVYVTVLVRQNDLRAKLVRIDAASGRVVFDLYLGSRDAYDWRGQASPPPAPSASTAGHVLVATGLGAVAAVDPSAGDLAWIARYPTPPRASQSVYVEESRRFRPTPLSSAGDLILAAPVDGHDLLALDPLSGETRWRVPRGEARFCLTQGERVFLLGSRLRVFERSSGRLLLTGPDLGRTALAKPLLFGEELLAVTAAGFLRVSLADGSRLGEWRFDDPAREVGVPTLLGGRLVTAGYEQLNVYLPSAERERVLATLEGGIQARDRGLYHARRGESREALVHLRRALQSGLTETEALPAQAAGLALMSEEAFARQARGDAAGFRVAAATALAFLGQLGLKEELHIGRAQRDLLHDAGPLLCAYADDLARSAGEAEWPRASQAFQRLLSAPLGTRVEVAPGIRVEASVYARARLIELVRERGIAVYGDFAQQAKRAFGEATSSGDRAALLRVIKRWPPSPEARAARWRLAELYASQGLYRPAAVELEAYLADYPSDELAPEALARLVQLYQDTRRPARARLALEQLLALRPEPTLRGKEGAETQPASSWARPHTERLYAGLSAEVLAHERDLLGLEDPLTEVYRSPTVLDMSGPELVEPIAPQGMGGRALLAQGDNLALIELPEGRVLLRLDGVSLRAGRVPVLTSARLILPLADRVVGYDFQGQLLWTQRFALGQERPRIGADPVHRLAAAGKQLYVLTGDSQVASLDPQSGEVRWRRDLGLQASLGLVVDEERVVALSAAPAALECLDAAEGKPLWRLEPQVAQARLSAPVWCGAGRLALVAGGKLVLGLDARQGSELWRVSSGERWLLQLQAAPKGGTVVATTQAGARYGTLAIDTERGVERWRDTGAGALRPGQEGGGQPDGEAPRELPADLVEKGTYMGAETLYTVRSQNGRTEIWAQDLKLGTRRWSFPLPIGARAFSVLETPSLVLVPNSGMISTRLQLDVLDWGTGKTTSPPTRLQGRLLRGAMAQISGGHLILSGEKGIYAFARSDPDRLQEEAVTLARALVAQPQDASLRARLANRLDRVGLSDEAVALLSQGMLQEGLLASAFDRLFAQLTLVRERQVEQTTPTYGIRRMPRPPEIDGELNDWWQGWTALDLKSPSYVLPIQQGPGIRPGRWTGAEDLSAKLYLGYDDVYLYFVLDVADLHMRPYDSEAENWVGDCLLIAIDPRNDGGETAHADDLLLTLALTLPKKKKEGEDEEEQKKQQEEEERNRPEGRYFVHRKEDKSGAVYEVAIPWTMLSEKGAMIPPGGPPKGLQFGMNVVLTDDDGERGGKDGPRGAVKALELSPGLLLHTEKSRLWRGYIPKRFAKIRLD